MLGVYLFAFVTNNTAIILLLILSCKLNAPILSVRIICSIIFGVVVVCALLCFHLTIDIIYERIVFYHFVGSNQIAKQCFRRSIMIIYLTNHGRKLSKKRWRVNWTKTNSRRHNRQLSNVQKEVEKQQIRKKSQHDQSKSIILIYRCLKMFN